MHDFVSAIHDLRPSRVEKRGATGRKVTALLLCFWALSLLGVAVGRGQVAHAQSLGDRNQSGFNRAAVYRYAAADDVVMRVNVWGAVQNPGIYEVPRGIDLNTLFSAAGGPSLSVRRQSDSQTVEVKLERKVEGGGYEVVYQETMEDEIVVPEENPELQEGDVLTVRSYLQRGFNWRDFLSIGTSFASLILTAVNIATR